VLPPRLRPRLLAKRRFLVATVLVASIVGADLVVTPGAGALTVSNFAAESGRQIMTSAMSAALAQGSCTSSSSTTITGQAYSSITNTSTTSGQQTLRLGNATSIVRVVKGVVYIYDDAKAIQDQFGVSAPKDANRWIAIPSSNSNFTRFNSGILLSSVMSMVTPAGPLKTGPVMRIDHVLVVGVTGKPNIHLGLASGTETVYVATTGPHVPIELVATDTVQGQKNTFTITYSNWGKDFHLSQPASSTPISSTKLPG
jgi:hypothetical protein